MKQQTQLKTRSKRLGKLTARSAEETLGKFFRLEFSKGSWRLKERRRKRASNS